MAIDPDVLAMMKQTIFVAQLDETPGSRSAGGDPAYLVPVAMRCRWEDEKKTVKNRDGVEITLSHFFATDGIDLATANVIGIKERYKVWPPGQTPAGNPEGFVTVATALDAPDEDGDTSHWEARA